MFKPNFATSLLASVSTILVAAPAFAQKEPAAEAAAPDGDIIVTAQRKDESLSKTPVAVAVLSADTLAKANIVSEQDLRSATPGLSVRLGFGSNDLNFALRGQSQDANSSSPPGVLPYVNEVQVSGSGGASTFYDLQSVQVLKGPQGTLFGRSATGGAVLFTTAKPSDKFGGYVSALAGNYGAFKAEGAVTGALVKDVANARIAGFYQKKNGFQTNIYNGGNKRVGDYERYGARGSLSLMLGSGITNDLVVDYSKTTGQNNVSVISGLLPLTTLGNPPYVDVVSVWAGNLTPGAVATGTLNSGQSAANYNAYFNDPTHPRGGITAVLAAQKARGPYIVDSNAGNSIDAENIIITNTTSFDVGENTKIKNIFGYSNVKLNLQIEADGTPYVISETAAGRNDTLKTVSNELQLVGTALGDKLSYVTGLYFSDSNFGHDQTAKFFDIFFLPGAPGAQINHYNIKNTTYAGYVQGTYQLNDSGLAVTLGLRYTSEKVRKILAANDGQAGNCLPANATFSCDQSRTFDRLSWQFGLQDQINSNVLFYAVTRRAYKSGGYNGSVQPKVGFANVGGDAFLAETLTDVELGMKINGDVGGMPLRLNLAGYYNWIKNSQRTAYGIVASSPAALTVNVPNGTTYGVEIDLQVKPAPWLSVGGTFNYTKATFGADTVFANGSAQIFDQVPDTPEASGTLFADVTVPVSGNITGLLHGDVYAQSKTFNSPQSINNVGTVIDGYAITNFRVGLEDKTVGWSLTANLKNAFNRIYYSGGIPTGAIYQINVLTPAEPRTFTLEARFKF